METERPIKDCLNLIKRDMRLMNLASAQREPTDTVTELLNVLDKMAEIARSQAIVEQKPVQYQEAHC